MKNASSTLSLAGSPRGVNALAAALLIYVFPLYPLVPRFSWLGPLGSDDIIPVLTVVLAAWATVCTHARQHRLAMLWRGQSRLVVAALALLALVSFAGAAHHVGSLLETVPVFARVCGRFFFYAALVVVMCHGLGDAGRRRFLTVVAAVVVLEAGIGLLTYVFEIRGPYGFGMLSQLADPRMGGRSRVQGTFFGAPAAGEVFHIRANFYSAYLVLGMFALAAPRHLARPGARVLAGFVVVCGIVVSYSRMSLLAALVGVVVAALVGRSSRGRSHHRAARPWIVAGVGVLLVVALTPVLLQRFTNVQSDRVGLWRLAVQVIVDHPRSGVGDGRYVAVARSYPKPPSVEVVRTPHNSFLYAAASFGVGSALMVALVYVACAVWALSSKTKSSPLGAAAVGVLSAFVVHDLSNNLMFVPEVATIFFAVFAALTSMADSAQWGDEAPR